MHGKREWSLSMEWEPRDLWVGVYWNRRPAQFGGMSTEVYVCVLPCLPIVFKTWVSPI